MKRNIHQGSNFNDFLKDEGVHEDVEAAAIRKVIASKLAPTKSETRAGPGVGASLLAIQRLEKVIASKLAPTKSETRAGPGVGASLLAIQR